MTDNPENEGFGDNEENFDNFEKKQGSLAAMWREKPLFKVGVVVAAAAVIFGTIFLFGGNTTQKPEVSMVPSGSEITAPPGTEEATPAYIEAVKEQNENRTEEAQREGTSSLPTPIEPPVGRVAVPEEASAAEDPLQRWRKLQEERLERELQKTQTLTPQNVPQEEQEANRDEAVQKLSGIMTQQMQAILESKNEVKVNSRQITDPDWLDNLAKKEEEDRKNEAVAAGEDQNNVDIEEILLPAGQIAYAQLLTAASSDTPGPVLAQIAGGPLNGSRVLGSFQKQDEYLVLKFDTIVMDGIDFSVDGIALDPKTTLPALRSDINHHYLKRVALPMAASFIEGMGNALSESGRTSITVTGDTVASSTNEASSDQKVAAGVDEAAQKLSQILDDIADKSEPTITLKAGTRMGILFTSPVVKPDDENRIVAGPSGLQAGRKISPPASINALRQARAIQKNEALVKTISQENNKAEEVSKANVR